MYETGNAARDIELAVLAIVVLVCALIVLVPWGRKSAFARIATHLPLLALPTYAVYEWLMPSNFDIRIDLLVLWPALAICLLGWIVKMLWRRRAPTQS